MTEQFWTSAKRSSRLKILRERLKKRDAEIARLREENDQLFGALEDYVESYHSDDFARQSDVYQQALNLLNDLAKKAGERS